MRFVPLYTPKKIGRMTVKNRLVMPPMVRNYAAADGAATPRYIDHIETIARGGVGLMILEASFIHQGGKGFKNELGIQSDAMVPGLKKLAQAAHKHGAKIGIQLYHGGRQANPVACKTQPISASAVKEPLTGVLPKAMTLQEIKQTVARYGAAAKRAKQAGLDCVEIHGAHGYLITQFLSPFSNKRKDQYGGSLKNRMRFLDEVYIAVRTAVGDNFPVIVRLSGDEMVKGGLTISESKKIAQHLEELGADALHISAGNYASYPAGFMIAPMAQPDGVLVKLAAQVKTAVKIPVITVGKIRTPEMAQEIIKKGLADFVAIGRTLLADPEWPNKVREGRELEIAPCIACNQGCISRLFAQQDVWCTVNPACGRERQFGKARKTSKKVAVVGGGPAGLKAAKIAAQRGAKVLLYEKGTELGGQLMAAAAAPHRNGWNDLRKSLIRDLDLAGVEIKLGQEFEAATALKEKIDTVILAAGSEPVRPELPGSDKAYVVTARDLMEGKAEARGDVVVAGGGCMGAQTAELLAEQGHKVTVVEMSGEIAVEAPIDDRALLLGRLKKRGVETLTKTKLVSLEQGSALVAKGAIKKRLKADTVVICFGSYPQQGLKEQLKGKVKNIITVGDAKQVRRVTDAILEGALAGLAV